MDTSNEFVKVEVKREIKIDLSSIWTVEGLKRAVRATGSYFFSPDTMRFFKSRVAPGLIHTEQGLTFITSEQNTSYYPEYHNEPRLYTLRILRENGDIDELSEFQEYETLRQARKAQKDYAAFVARLP